jgi:hypothetical protein
MLVVLLPQSLFDVLGIKQSFLNLEIVSHRYEISTGISRDSGLIGCRDSFLPSQEVTGGTRLPPNVTKILYQWGYEESLRRVAVKSSAIDFYLCRSIYKIISSKSCSRLTFL